MRMIDERILYRIVEFYLIRTVFTFYVKEERYHLRNSNWDILFYKFNGAWKKRIFQKNSTESFSFCFLFFFFSKKLIESVEKNFRKKLIKFMEKNFQESRD